MRPFNITLVSGSAGAGKTTWIRQQISQAAEAVVYFSLGSGETAIDAAYLAAEAPGLTVLPVTQLNDFLDAASAKFSTQLSGYAGHAVYLELGFHLDLKSLILPQRITNVRRVAVLPPGSRQTEWHDWADIVVTGSGTRAVPQQLHLWRSALTGQVLDDASLNTFWYELTHGAYGKIQRAKGIFDVADGRSLYLDFVAELPEVPPIELNLPRCLNGRPDRFSGIEIVGEVIVQEAIAQTIEDCCLDDRTIVYYQQQIQQQMNESIAQEI